MNYKYTPYQDSSFSNHLTHSAVYRPASPSPSKLFTTSSHILQKDLMSHLKPKGSFCSPQTHKKNYLRNTVEATQSFSYYENKVGEIQNKSHKNGTFQAKQQTERSPFKAICFNLKTEPEQKLKNEQKNVERKVAYSLKNNFQSQQPLFNKIIKKIDDKQKLLNQIKKIAETQLPTRSKKPHKQPKSIINLYSTKSKALNHSFMSSSYVGTNTYQDHSLREKYASNTTSNKNPQEKKVKTKQPTYFTPKTSKSYDVESQIKSNSSTLITYQKYSTPQNATKSGIFDKQQPFMKKRSFISYQLGTQQVKAQNKTPKLSKITSIQGLTTKKQASGPKLSDFIIVKTLGEGKFGTVLQVLHKQSGFIFALKKISKETIKTHLMIQQLALQIRIQSFCNHKNIVKIYAVFDDNEHLYLLLEYMQEGTLFNYLKKKRKLEEIEAAIKVKQVAEAVKYLHDHGIAHRDIKPENIVLTNGISKLCDFGWAAICNQRRRTYCGTFDYAAPQILQGSQYDMSVDMWCMGVLAYELLVGKAPFYHISRKQTMKKIMNVNPTNIEFPHGLSKNAVDFIKKLLIKQPEQRMTAEAVLKHPFLAQLNSQ